ncbi:MAG TPA: hypothetical protein VGK19_03790 [Capsulimonadaceae bacterium]|jgi:hypothetical protein
MDSLLKLLETATTTPLSQERVVNGRIAQSEAGGNVDQLEALLKRRNGFYAFGAALHVFPLDPASYGYGLSEWNARDLWKCEYKRLSGDMLCFAEDAFGDQFAIQSDQIVRFVSEEGRCDPFAGSLDEWAARILADPAVETGYPLLSEWQSANRCIDPSERLHPTIPFITGGKYEIGNLHALDAATGMKLYGEVDRQIGDIPDGSVVRLKVGD